MATQSITTHLPTELVDRLDQLASRFERPRGWLVKQAVHDWLEREAERERLTREALASVDAGEVIEGELIQAWAESLSGDQPLPRPGKA